MVFPLLEVVGDDGMVELGGNQNKNFKWFLFFLFPQKKRNKRKLVAVFLYFRSTSEITTISVITGVLPRGARISVRFTCFKNKATFRFRGCFNLRVCIFFLVMMILDVALG